MFFSFKIETENDAVSGPTDVAALMEKYAAKLREMPNVTDCGKILDANGNTVGRWDYMLDD